VKNEIGKYIIPKDRNIKDALKKIEENVVFQAFTLFVVDDNCRVIGSVTDGDVRRAIIGGASITDTVQHIMRRDFQYILDVNDYRKIKLLKSLDLKLVPLVSEDMKIIDIINLKIIRSILPVDAVIMAGGKGIRLRPYTDNVPKPMLDLKGKPIIAHNMDRLIKYGVKKFYISVNYMKECIKEYIDEHYSESDVEYIEENEPLGTIGSLRLIKKFVHKDLLIINADILTNLNFDDFFYKYKEIGCDMLVATFDTKVDIPYAVLDICDEKVSSLIEKPTYTYYSNAGIYLMKRDCVDLIPDNETFNATDLMDSMIKNNRNIYYFPLLGYWLDIGTAQNYLKAKEDIKYVRF
jgi:dTDP-glucose pyrophosphorylase